MNGQSKFEGHVEVCDNGEWRTVCSDMWDEREATVVCRQFGFAGNINGKYIMFIMFNYQTKEETSLFVNYQLLQWWIFDLVMEQVQ